MEANSKRKRGKKATGNETQNAEKRPRKTNEDNTQAETRNESGSGLMVHHPEGNGKSQGSGDGKSARPKMEITSKLDGPSKGSHDKRKIIVVLQKASLETIKTKKGYELVSADSHKSILSKLKKDISEYRPDIVHQCLLTLLDSPLNKAGLLKVYIETRNNQIIDVHPSLRIPRTFKRFAGLMVQLLHKMKIRAVGSSDILMKMIKRPMTGHLPAGALKIGTSNKGTLVDLRRYIPTLNPDNGPLVFAVGAMAHGQATVDWQERCIAVSQYALSGSVALGRIMNAFENYWNIL